ncbi:MAG: methylenetetrahydrofolate reductase C-terminal domain-containing protein [Deltaproteobacteria bacterium]|nr:methylenetetrahydrofolate reductase C-terminal domain-containing protein [Deltaproteobacteria bacterium]MBW1955253.1 methylenetetrahydrofolate reductase C-terminal domain-containing protein [Deltaproteobacteria bacterium]MBW2041801.1 methylenetetrahydrofolate reductase C-terminal domain-containing protein [Deltaproteobacteria bacterium]MBW2132422.1 methylenetetrahydrofolate reductase C-terminal domain-containing protein [Deltaproteobacteria bacterium]
MIVAKRKPIEEIKELLSGYQKVLNVGCGTCVSVCLVGGEKEVNILNAEIEMSRKMEDNPIEMGAACVERQCDREFLAALDDKVGEYEALMSMACGVGIQFLAERFPDKPVLPAVNTTGLAVNQDIGWYEERCRSCGNCVLGWTAGICPVTMCAKSLYNGPCGGTNKGSCEIHTDQPCAWHMIYERLSQQGRLDLLMKVHPANDWQDIGPRTLIQPGYEKTVEEGQKK